MKRGLFVLIVLVFISIYPFANKNGLLDIPTAEIQKNGEFSFGIDFSLSSALANDNVPFTYNLFFSYGLFDLVDISLNMLTYKDYSFDVQYNFLKSKGNLPSVSAGIRNITYRKYIDEGGGGSDPSSGLSDNQYLLRSQDWFSFYVVTTKDFNKYGKYTLGIGRGEFVGFGRGKYLSTSILFDEQSLSGGANDFMFSFFGGAEIPIVYGLSFLGDVTGRNVNLGLKYNLKDLNLLFGLTHAELFTSGDPTLKPRMEINANYTINFGGPKKESMGTLIVNVVDATTDKLLDATLTFEESNIQPISLTGGYKKIQIKPGKYTLKIESNGYKWQKRIFTVSSGITTELNVKLNKKNDTEKINHDKAIQLAKDAKTLLNKGDIVGALSKLNEAIKLSPDDPTVLAYMQEANTKKQQMIKTYRENALSYEAKGWTKSAISEWNNLLLLDPNNSEAKNHLDELKKEQKKEEQKTVEKPKETKPAQNPNKLYEEGYAAYLAGDYKTAVAKFEAVLKIDPNHKNAAKYLEKAKKRL
uniref:Tetratricopeptide repeat protein n=1 Tax=candidate division WOR-3 bacterium TaxID=2052148 RepID=A0A7C3N677_UNCW3